MATERILYTDGHDVTVTDSTFRVRKHFYRLDGITGHSFSIVKPNRIPGFVFIGLGLIGLIVGVSSESQQSNFAIQISSIILESNIILSICGAVLIVVGIVFTIVIKEKYGVHIVTADGEKDVLVSNRREYVSMVVEVLNKAFINMLRKTGKDDSFEKSRMKMSVSHR